MKLFIIYSFTTMLLSSCGLFNRDKEIASLQTEIAKIESSIAASRKIISENTKDLSEPGRDIGATVNYRLVQKLSDQIKLAPTTKRKLTFQQTNFSGYLDSQSRRCRLNGKSREGRRVQFENRRATTASLVLKNMRVQPKSDGFNLVVSSDLNVKTQIKAAVKPPCIGGWTPWTSVGVKGSADPRAVFSTRLSPVNHNTIKIQSGLNSTSDLDVELVTKIAGFNVRHTLEVADIMAPLNTSFFELPIEDHFVTRLPNGESKTTQIKFSSYAVRASDSGVGIYSKISK